MSCPQMLLQTTAAWCTLPKPTLLDRALRVGRQLRHPRLQSRRRRAEVGRNDRTRRRRHLVTRAPSSAGARLAAVLRVVPAAQGPVVWPILAPSLRASLPRAGEQHGKRSTCSALPGQAPHAAGCSAAAPRTLQTAGVSCCRGSQDGFELLQQAALQHAPEVRHSDRFERRSNMLYCRT